MSFHLHAFFKLNIANKQKNTANRPKNSKLHIFKCCFICLLSKCTILYENIFLLWTFMFPLNVWY